MTVPESQRHAEFNRWYADLRTPTPVTAPVSARLSDMSHHFRSSEVDRAHVDAEFLALAHNRDIDGLLRAHESPTAARALEEARAGTRSNVTYCVAHLLVDGSGHEDFARAWIDAHAPSERTSAITIQEICDENGWSKARMQQLLGMSTLQNFFAHPSHGQAPFTYLGGTNNTAERANECSNMLAAILRLNHPGEPPTIAATPGKSDLQSEGLIKDRPLIDLLWLPALMMDNLLPAMEQCYGRGNATVEAGMQSNISRLIRAGRLAPNPVTTIDARWEALATWGTSQNAKDILGSQLVARDKRYFCHELMDFPELICTRLGHLKRMGLDDFDHVIELSIEPIDQRDAPTSSTTNLLCIAAERRNLEVIAWLLNEGCDPLKQTINPFRPDGLESPISVLADPSSINLLADDVRPLAMLRAAAAKRAANAALDDVADPTRTTKP